MARTKNNGISFRTDDDRFLKLEKLAEARHCEGPHQLAREVMEALADNPDGLTDGERALRDTADQLRVELGQIQRVLVGYQKEQARQAGLIEEIRREQKEQRKIVDDAALMARRAWDEISRTSLMVETICRLMMPEGDFRKMEVEIDDPALPQYLWRHRMKMEGASNGAQS